MGDEYHGYKDLIVYKKAFKLSTSIFKTTKAFPKEEMFSLTDQMRRSSRSVCSNMAEAFRVIIVRNYNEFNKNNWR